MTQHTHNPDNRNTNNVDRDTIHTGNRRKFSRWKRWQYQLNGLVLILPFWYLYDALTPVFPPEWSEQAIGPFTAAPTPASDEPPYPHDGAYQKDFSVRFCAGCVPQIRAAYLSVGKAPAPLPSDGRGILHGDNINQHVHAPFPAVTVADDKLWLSVQQWNGEVHQVAWALPTEWLNAEGTAEQ